MPGLQIPPTVVLIVRAGALRCALHVSHVVEIMRPLPIEPVGTSPAFVLGASVIRGAPVPVVHLAGLLGDGRRVDIARIVCLRVGIRRLALAVEEVVELRSLEASSLDGLPPLLYERDGVADAIGVLDSELLLLLGTARIIPGSAWEQLEKSGK